jgi:endonuclease/exonuclease/phosphatase family metal-dependent hydrolase
VLLGTALSPHGVFLLIRVLVLRTMSPDMMGLTVLVKRRCRDTAEAGWLSADKITAHPFAHDLRAYPQPGLRQWPVYWVSHCFIRPGFMLVRCTGGLRECEDIWVATAHLVISARGTSENPRRIEQVTKLNDALVSLVEVHQATAYGSTDKLLPSDVNLQVEPETSASPSAASLPSSPMLVVGGDFNAPDNSPEIDYMCKAGFLDCASSAPFLTWDQALNPYTQFDLAEPNARMDYVFMSGQRTDDPRQAVDTTLVSTARAFDGDTAPIVSDHFGVLATIRVESAV